jgi:hypothetical protein
MSWDTLHVWSQNEVKKMKTGRYYRTKKIFVQVTSPATEVKYSWVCRERQYANSISGEKRLEDGRDWIIQYSAAVPHIGFRGPGAMEFWEPIT